MTVDIPIGNWYRSGMAKAPDSKEKTLAAAARLFSQRGYHGTALQDILVAGGAPRGSLYFHFPNGKEEIGLATVALGAEAVRAFIAQAAGAATMEAFLTALARGMGANLEASGFNEGCPIATTALETAAQSDALGAATRAAFQSWEAEIARGLRRFGMTAADAGPAATAILSLLEGALLLARTYRSLEPMRRAERAVVRLVK
jgi:TetR/AcrR family transcriptional regulator, lmrAB and yxaGH operons repressor